MPDKPTLKQLMKNLPQQGTVEWIGVRSDKRKLLTELERVLVLAGGLDGDHYAGQSGKRSVTLIQAEHLAVIASLLHRPKIDPQTLRRNIVISN